MQVYLKRQLWITSSCFIGQLLVGCGLGWTAPIIPKLQDQDQSPLPSEVTETETSLIGSLFLVGSIAGPYVTGYLCNVLGRKPCFYLAGLLTMVSFLLLALANNLAMIYVGRVCIGLGIGIIYIVNLVYIGEIASTNIRGTLLTSTFIFTSLGTLTIYSVGPFVIYPVISYIPVGISALYLLGTMFIPESPTYLILKDRIPAANEVMKMLGRSEEIVDVNTLKRHVEKQNSFEEWKQIFTVKSNRKALIITLILSLLQQGSGIFAVTFFATTIFELAGSSIEPSIATILVGVTQLFASILTPLFVERVGRKILLLMSTAVCSLSLAILGVYFYLDLIDHSSTSNLQWLPLVTLILFVTSYYCGFGIIPAAFVGEMFHSNVRGTGSTISVTIGWLFGFGVMTVYGDMVLVLGSHITFWMFSAMCCLAFLFTLLFVPETKGKTLDEIRYMLNK